MSGHQVKIIASEASADEAAALVAAIEQFLRDTAPQQVGAESRPSAWKRAALAEGVARQPDLHL